MCRKPMSRDEFNRIMEAGRAVNRMVELMQTLPNDHRTIIRDGVLAAIEFGGLTEWEG